MKKVLSLLLVVLLVALSVPSFASDIDLSSMSFDDLVALKLKVENEIMSRPENKEVSVPAGIYEIGVHIPAGEYTLTADGSYAAITVSTTDDFEDYAAMISIDSIDEDTPVGRMSLKTGQFVKIEYGSIMFTTFTGLGF